MILETYTIIACYAQLHTNVLSVYIYIVKVHVSEAVLPWFQMPSIWKEYLLLRAAIIYTGLQYKLS